MYIILIIIIFSQALLEECATHFPELFPWVSWSHGQHPTLWHPMGVLSSEHGVQQEDPLGPLLFSLVLHKLIRTIIEDTECSQLLLNSWYLDDGVLSGTKSVICRAVTLVQRLGSALGLCINPAKCELFSRTVLSEFPQEMKVSQEPNFKVLGAPIGDPIFCARFSAQRHA